MAIRNIRIDGDDILRKTCRPVTEMTPKIQELIDDMLETMYEADGVGLAAPQIGVVKRIVVIDDREGHKFALINPKITAKSGTQRSCEGCLSLPGYRGEVDRPQEVTVEALDEYGEPVTIHAKDFLAVIFCHELDHLDGILYKDLAVNYEQV